jgi:ribonuclease BN (tRNA processing enzyme)
VRITVLGKSPSWQDPGGACSGYLVEDGATRLLLDCGSGVFAKLRGVCDHTTVDTVILSHLHADHFLDLVPFSYALAHAPRSGPPAVPRLLAPPGARAVLGRVTGAWGSEDLVAGAFDLCEYDPARTIEVGCLRLRFHPVPHFVPAWAIEIRSTVSAGRFTFGADCGPNEGVVEFARGSDLLMLEATLSEPGPQPEPGTVRGHLTAAEAGDHARRAGVKRLVVTHFPAELGEHVRAAAEGSFGRAVCLAAEGAVYTV